MAVALLTPRQPTSVFCADFTVSRAILTGTFDNYPFVVARGHSRFAHAYPVQCLGLTQALAMFGVDVFDLTSVDVERAFIRGILGLVRRFPNQRRAALEQLDLNRTDFSARVHRIWIRFAATSQLCSPNVLDDFVSSRHCRYALYSSRVEHCLGQDGIVRFHHVRRCSATCAR